MKDSKIKEQKLQTTDLEDLNPWPEISNFQEYMYLQPWYLLLVIWSQSRLGIDGRSRARDSKMANSFRLFLTMRLKIQVAMQKKKRLQTVETEWHLLNEQNQRGPNWKRILLNFW